MRNHLLRLSRQFGNGWSTFKVACGIIGIPSTNLRIPTLLIAFMFYGVLSQAQTASFTHTPTVGGAIPHTVFFTDQSTLPDTWFWDFGDFNTSTLQNPVHNYTTTGEFDVKLIVTDTITGGQDMITKKVRVSIPNANFTGTGSNFFPAGGGGSFFGCGPLTTNFVDSSTGDGAAITSWSWDFGDGGSSTDQNPTHTYSTSGFYNVSLTVTDAFGNTHTRTRTNFAQVLGPNVNFTSNTTTNGGSPLTVSFQNQTVFVQPITSWTWNFGDGGTSNQQNPSHTYNTIGTFDVSLTVTDIDGCSRTLTKTNFVNTISGAFDITKAIFEGNEDRFSVSGQAPSPRSLAFNLDGTKMFVLDETGANVNEYNLSSGFDVSTAVYAGDGERFSVAAQETLPRSIAFSSEGTKLFVLGRTGDDINEYDLSTAFDVSTAVYAGDAERFAIAAQETGPSGLAFNSDGTKMYVTGTAGADVNEYSLSNAFDVSTASFVTNFSVSAQETSPQSIDFVNNGATMLIMGTAGDDINAYNLTTAFDISTASFAGDAERFSVVSQENQPNSLVFTPDGTKMYVMGTAGRDINQYSLAVPVITGALANQAVNDNATTNPFAAVTVQEPNDDNVSAIIALDDNAKGVLTGTGLTGTGPYTLASTDVASLQASLRALVFNPTDNRTATSETTTFTLTVADDTFSDIDNRTTVVSSAVAPSVSITSPSSVIVNGAFTTTFTFSEAVTDFVLGDISVGNGAASNFTSTSTSVYTTTITPAVNGAVTVDVAADVAQDLGTVGNTAATQFSITADLTAPTVTITSGAANPINGAFTTTFTFSEAVTGFDISDITVGNGTASAFASTSASVYTATITPTTDGAVTVDVAANAAQDAAANGNTAATQFSITADLTAPTLTITTGAVDPINGALTTMFTFSEAVTGFNINDIMVGNGTASAFASTSASVYTATIIPTTDGAVTVDVAANVAQDAATNGNTAATQFSITADLTAPTATITSGAADPTNGAFTTTFTFLEAVTGFDINDITVGNGTASAFVSTSASVYTATITPTTDGAVTVDVTANVAQDAATNGNTAATQFSITADLTAPTATITSAAADPTNGAFNTTFTFSEAVTGFALGDITVGNGTASAFASTSTSVYTATITPTTDGAVTVDVAANVAQDAATNGNTAATQFSITADLTAPTVTITSGAADPTNGAFTTTFTFSEAVTGFALGDITVGNGTASAFASTSASVYTATITPTTDGAVTVDVAANVAQDAATNGNTAATQFSITADLTAPTVTITSGAADPTNGAFTTTFTFSEAVTGFALGDITVGNGTASAFASTSASVYTATITPTTDGAVTVDVAANVAQDAATNGNTAATQFSITADLTAPTVTITSGAADPTNGAFTTTFTFSEAVTGFALGDITVGNGTASAFASASASVYTATITPTTDGAVTVDVAANVAQDAATNGNTAATQFSITADLTAPTLIITSGAADPTNGAFTTTFTFLEAVTGFDINDITVGNGTASAFVSTSASVYTATITPTTDGAVTVDVAANVVQDAATNGNTAATQFSITADLTAPTVTITSGAADPIDGAFNTTFTFSEAVTGFDIDDITVGNGTASAFASTSASVYTATITPTTDGAVTVDVAANVAQDAATNGNTVATQFSITADLTAPTATITSGAADPTNGAFTTAFTFSETVTGFDINDITVGNGTASAFASTSASVYTATITPTTDGAVTVDVAANVVQDAAANGNTAATQFSITADLTDPTVTITSGAADPIDGAFTTTFTFSEAVTGFDINDITVGNGAASAFVSTSTSVYTATITPTTDGAVTVDVAANVAQDAATNGNTAATQFSITADLTAPTLIITSGAADPTNGAFTTTFTFLEAVTGFDINDITVGNGTASAFVSTSASVYTATITPTTDGAVTVDVAANVVQDAATNGNTAATQFSITADLTAPTVTITSGAADPIDGAFTTTFTFSEAITGFDMNDIKVGNGTASAFASTSTSVYTATITPTTDGAVTVDVDANVAQDAAANGNTAATQFSITADLTDPTVTITSGAADPIDGAFTTTFTFSEAVTGFDINDITVGNGTASAFASTSASVYNATITPTTDGAVTVDVAANIAQDAATNGNTAATQFSIIADLTAPTLSVENVPVEVNDFLPFKLDLIFSEPINGLVDGDFSLINLTLQGLTRVTENHYELALAANNNADLRILLPTGSFMDLAGNLSTMETVVEINYNSLPSSITLSNVSIAENNALADQVGTFSTIDQDTGDFHTYRLVTGTGDDDNDKFRINFDRLRAATSFNFEEQATLSIRVQTDDGRGGIRQDVFSIAVSDVNETPTDLLLGNLVLEETDETDVLVGNFSTEDPDLDETFVYDLVTGMGDNDNDFFLINGTELRTTKAINFEEKEVLRLRVRVTDSGNLIREETFEIGITNVNLETLRDFTKDRPDARVKNFFTPNGDGLNDVWVIEDILDNPVNEVKVYSQGGQLVFSASNYQNDWRGDFKGQALPSGTYYYEINVFNGAAIIRGMLLILTK